MLHTLRLYNESVRIAELALDAADKLRSSEGWFELETPTDEVRKRLASRENVLTLFSTEQLRTLHTGLAILESENPRGLTDQFRSFFWDVQRELGINRS